MLTYRADIDGLRAIAVLLVLLFHLDFSLFSGGFIGVDVFFVISGFLISSIILKQKSSNEFSFVHFYTRRALRILPAYLVVLFISIIIGVFLLAPLALKSLLESALSSSIFLSNLYFLFTQGGYFSASAHELPLLHTWSLSVEEQFYLIMPITIIFLLKIKSQKKQFWLFTFLFSLSLLASILITDFNQKAAYFFVFSRAYEFLVGAFLALILTMNNKSIQPSLKLANNLFLLGLGCIILSATMFDTKTMFPSGYALLPCLGTLAILFSGINKQCVSHFILGNKFLVFIGLISYSLYLFHWPIISITKYIGLEFTLMVKFSLAGLSVLLAFINWKFIERRIRDSNLYQRPIITLVFYLSLVSFISIFYFYAQSENFFPERFSRDIVRIEKILKAKPENNRQSCHSNSLKIDFSDRCKLGTVNGYENKAILWGDSHANHFVGFMDELGKAKKIQVQDITMGNCPPLVGVYINAQGAKENCINKNKKVLEYILKEKPDRVYLAGSWAGYFDNDNLKANSQQEKIALIIDSLTRTIDIFHKNNIKVSFFEMVPKMESKTENLSTCYLKHFMYPSFNSLDSCNFTEKGYFENELEDINLRLKTRFNDKLQFISVSSLFCENQVCHSYLENLPLYRDNHHLNLDGSKLLGIKHIQNQGD